MLKTRLRRSGRLLPVLLATTIGLIAAAGALVWTRTQIFSLRYQLSGWLALESKLRHEIEKLQIETAALSAPERIEGRARSLGLTYPNPGQIVHLPQPVAARPQE